MVAVGGWQECLSPFDWCDIVTSTTHKGLRGPRGGIVFFRRGLRSRGPATAGVAGVAEGPQYNYEDKLNFAVHPTLQGGPHPNHIAALAVALNQVCLPPFRQYVVQVKKNAGALAAALIKRGCRLVTNGTDNHLMLWDLRPIGITGKMCEKVCELCSITLNKNAVFGEASSWAPGVRLGE